MAEGMGGKMLGWVEAHPTESIVIGIGGAVVIMWMLGFFSSGSSQANAGASNLASAYYAAEAQQAVVGGQIQMATINQAGETARAALGDTAATAIEATKANAATIINGQNADASTALGVDQLNATYSNNATTVAVNASNNATAAHITDSNNNAMILGTLANSIIPSELANYGQASITTPFGGALNVGPALAPNPNWLSSLGYSDATLQRMGVI